MVSPGTHLVKNHEFQSRMLGPLCDQTVNLKTDSKALYYSILKLKINIVLLFKSTTKAKRNVHR